MFSFHLMVLVLPVVNAYKAQSVETVPLVISPSGEWDGPDGPWASFNVGAAAPIQTFRAFPSMSLPVVLLPLQADWCLDLTNDICQKRGIFDPTASTHWKEKGLYDLPIAQYLSDDSTLNATFGLDTFTFGSTNNDIQLNEQIITGVESEKIPMGLFGLSDIRVDLGDGSRKTLLTSLRDFGQIASSSYSYTAGSFRRNAPASLVMGGYDASRFDSNTTIQLSMPSGMDGVNSTLLVHITSITFGTNPQTGWSNSIGSNDQIIPLIPIDSSIPQIWLPPAACKPFEDVFHLSWDESSQLYLINDTTHTKLQTENTSITFSILSDDKKIVNFTLPYSAFDLNISYPFVNTTSYYFPLKRTSRPNQSLLGRTFLQEVYITVDYDRRVFNLSQAYPAGNPRIFGISAPEKSSSITGPLSKPSSIAEGSASARIPPITTFGIVLGVAVPTLGLCVLLLLSRKPLAVFRKHKLKKELYKGTVQERFDKIELHGLAKPWVEAMGKERLELETTEGSHEVGGSQPLAIELDAGNIAQEMDASRER